MLQLPWTDSTIHVIDFEGNQTSGILEYGIVSIRKGKILQSQTRLCHPRGDIRPEDISLHGISPEQASSHPPIEEDWEIFFQTREAGPLAAHFATTENNLLKSVWPYPRHAPDFFGLGQMISEWGPWIDTGKLFTQLFHSIPSAKLETLLEAFRLQNQLEELARQHCPPNRCRYHCALYDALATTVLLWHLEEYPQFRGRSLLWLLEYSAPERLRKKGLFRQGRLF